MVFRYSMQGEAVVALAPVVTDTVIVLHHESTNIHLLETSSDIQADLASTDYDVTGQPVYA